jgi:hypothetical protein
MFTAGQVRAVVHQGNQGLRPALVVAPPRANRADGPTFCRELCGSKSTSIGCLIAREDFLIAHSKDRIIELIEIG